jgi:hypothetical protein
MLIWCAQDHCLCCLQVGDIENIPEIESAICKRYSKTIVAHSVESVSRL